MLTMSPTPRHNGNDELTNAHKFAYEQRSVRNHVDDGVWVTVCG